ncbi:uncharacterized protein LOC143461349 [Clavelina lepadiformis]|uniref:Taste receptor type 2 n=1 Tax=Clavelina lepadiformis TaxID=159417 RepID=A0ABP0FXF6_CLALP
MNQTRNFSLHLYRNEGRATAIITLETFLLVWGIYLLISLIYYVATKLRSLPDCIITQHCQRRKRVLFGLVVCFAVIVVSKLVLVQCMYYFPTHLATGSVCATFALVFQVLNSIGHVALYLFLWLRQYTLYQEPHLRLYATPCLLRFSYAVLAAIIMGGTAAIVTIPLSNAEANFNVIEGTNECVLIMEDQLNSVVIYAGYSLAVAMQICTLSLFIHILRRYLQSINVNVNLKAAGFRSNKRLHRLLRNCTMAAAVSAIADVIAVAMRVTYLQTSPESIFYAIAVTDSLISLVCTIFCFSNWKELLWPWVRSQNVDRQVRRDSRPSISSWL